MKIAKELTEGFMKPVIYYGRFFEIDTDHGTEWIDQDIIGKTLHPSKSDVANYIEGGEVFSISVVDGWAAYLSAPGYMDRTDLTVFPTEDEAVQFLNDTYTE